MANDFSGDSSIKAVWRFENGALTTDSKGTNTLSTANSPVADTVNYKEGAASVDLELGDVDYLYIADADTDSGFPLKNGDSTKIIFVGTWFKPESLPSTHILCSKYDYGTNKRSFVLYTTVAGAIGFGLGYNSGNNVEYVTIVPNSSISAGTFYYLGFWYRDSDKTWYRYFYTDGVGYSTDTGTMTNNINVEDAPWGIGVYFNSGSPASPHDGLIDEMIVGNAVKSEADIDSIRQGTYGAGSGPSNLKTLHGLAKASVKSVHGTALASVKTIHSVSEDPFIPMMNRRGWTRGKDERIWRKAA